MNGITFANALTLPGAPSLERKTNNNIDTAHRTCFGELLFLFISLNDNFFLHVSLLLAHFV